MGAMPIKPSVLNKKKKKRQSKKDVALNDLTERIGVVEKMVSDLTMNMRDYVTLVD
jgi:hypothetical protein